jgi:hypothetical protein
MRRRVRRGSTTSFGKEQLETFRGELVVDDLLAVALGHTAYHFWGRPSRRPPQGQRWSGSIEIWVDAIGVRSLTACPRFTLESAGHPTIR